MYRFARYAGRCAYYVVGGARAGITTNLAIVLGENESSSVVRSTAKRAFEHDAMNWIDTLRIQRLSLEEIQQVVRLEGRHLLPSPNGSTHGAVLVTLHLGNFDLVGQVLAASGYRLTVPVERMEPQALFDFLVELRAGYGITIVPVEHAARSLVRALRAGDLAGLAGDRSFAGSTLEVPVFGRLAPLPTGPVSLARRTHSPLLLAVGIRESPGRFRGVVREVEMTYSEDGAEDDARNLATFAGMMEQIVTEHPEQWLAFRPFWSVGGGENTAATMGHQKWAAV